MVVSEKESLKHLCTGRPKKDYINKSTSAQERDNLELSKNYSLAILISAASKGQILKVNFLLNFFSIHFKIDILAGNKKVSKVLKTLIHNPDEITKKLIENNSPVIFFTNDQACSFTLEYGFSKNTYNRMRKTFAEHGLRDLIPPYYKMYSSKIVCRPTDIIAADFSVTVPLKNILEHTTQRTVQAYPDSFESDDSSMKELYAYETYGGESFSITPYNQKAGDGFDFKKSQDANLYAVMINLVELRSSLGECIYRKPNPLSGESVRPYIYEFGKEDSALI